MTVVGSFDICYSVDNVKSLVSLTDNGHLLREVRNAAVIYESLAKRFALRSIKKLLFFLIRKVYTIYNSKAAAVKIFASAHKFLLKRTFLVRVKAAYSSTERP